MSGHQRDNEAYRDGSRHYRSTRENPKKHGTKERVRRITTYKLSENGHRVKRYSSSDNSRTEPNSTAYTMNGVSNQGRYSGGTHRTHTHHMSGHPHRSRRAENSTDERENDTITVYPEPSGPSRPHHHHKHSRHNSHTNGSRQNSGSYDDYTADVPGSSQQLETIQSGDPSAASGSTVDRELGPFDRPKVKLDFNFVHNWEAAGPRTPKR